MADTFAVVHLLTAAPTPETEARLNLLRRACPFRQVVLHLGPGAAVVRPDARVHAPPLLRAAALRRTLAHLQPPLPATKVLHAWSFAAAAWALPLRSGACPLLVEYDGTERPGTLARWSRDGAVAYACGSQAAANRLHAAGVPAPRCLVIRPPLGTDRDGGAFARGAPGNATEPRAAIREQLEVGAHEHLVALVPPLARRTGTFIAAWAALLLEKVDPRVRLVISPGSAEADRIRYLIRACRHERMFRVAPATLPWTALAAAADLAVWLPRGAGATMFAAQAAAAGTPLVATRSAVSCELLGAHYPWLCPAGEPHAAAATMLRALASPQLDRARVAQLRAEFASQRTCQTYARTYTCLASRRPPA